MADIKIDLFQSLTLHPLKLHLERNMLWNQLQDGMSDIDTNIHYLFIMSGMGIEKCRLINTFGKSRNLEVHMASVCQVINDHENQFGKDIAKDFAQVFIWNINLRYVYAQILCGSCMCNYYHINRDDVLPDNTKSGSKVV